ncbi:MAG TPA: ATP-binding protein [Gammaproteobacteria bacterium]
MPKTEKQQKISTRLIVYIILFSSMITAIVTVMQLYFQYIEHKSLLDSNIQHINTGYREGITNAVWLDDKVQLDSILAGVVALPDIKYVEVRVNSEIYSSRGSAVQANALSSSFPLHYRHDNKMLTIGETYVEANLSAIYQRLINQAWTILGLNAIKTSLVAIFMYFIFNRLVVSRVEDLSGFVRRYNVHGLENSVEVVSLTDNTYSDEITEIATALNNMHRDLSQSIKELLGLKKTLDSTLDSVVMFHPETYRIFYANAGATALLGYTTDELMAMTPVDICPELTESVLSRLATAASSPDNQALDIETFFQSKHGKLISVRLLLQYLHPDNEAPRYVFIARDISESIKARMEIQASLDETKAANAELESFSYSISHDLRAPLRSIDGFSLLLLHDYGDKIDDEGKNYIQRVRGNAQHMGLLIDDMLSLSNVTRGELHRTSCDLSEMAKSSIKKLQDYDPERKVTVNIAPGIRGWVDKSLFVNLLDNLLGNAWKYTGKIADPRIEFGSTTQGGQTVYYVRDNGAGFDMQYSNKLFTAFHRLHDNKEFTGTGIGLATVSRILSRHGGRIWAEAEIGKGATFYFTLDNAQHLLSHNTPKQPANRLVVPSTNPLKTPLHE